MSKRKFNGPLGKRIREHLQLRRGLGRYYEANEYILYRFNKLVHKRWPSAKTVTREMVMAFLRSSRHQKISSRKNELTYIRMLCVDLAAQGVKVYLPERRLLPKGGSSTRVHIFAEAEVLRVMKAAEEIRSPKASLAYKTLIGVFWSTGLRLQEAMGINIGDIDWEQRLLFVRKGKYGKTRLIPVSRSTLDALSVHLKKMRKLGISTNENDPLFVGQRGRRIAKRSASHMAKVLFERAGVKTAWGKYPRTVDLRHSFATNALKGVRAHGSDPSSEIPALAVVMGHSHIGHTQVYLHPKMETLQVASKAFERKLLKFKGAA